MHYRRVKQHVPLGSNGSRNANGPLRAIGTSIPENFSTFITLRADLISVGGSGGVTEATVGHPFYPSNQSVNPTTHPSITLHMQTVSNTALIKND